MSRHIAGLTVAITGASSGIGRAAALAFARAGANMVLGARRTLLLGELASEIQALGSRALAEPLDVADLGSVQHMAHMGHEVFGKIDVWINNAGVGLFGRFHEPTIELHRRVVEVNLLGSLYGASAALPYLKESHGVLINNACAVGVSGAPFASSYAAAAAGIRAMAASLRQEYRTMRVEVCTLLPAVVNTPFYEHAANFTGKLVLPKAALDPEQVAKAMLDLVGAPRPEIFIGRGPAMFEWLRALRPALAERWSAEQHDRLDFRQVTAPIETGNLFEPVHAGSGAQGEPFTTVSPAAKGRTAIAALGAAAVAALRGR